MPAGAQRETWPLQVGVRVRRGEFEDARLQEAQLSQSWKFNVFQGFARLKNARGGGVEVESSLSGFLPPWPQHLLDEGLLARGYILHQDAYGGSHPFQIRAPMPTASHGPSEWQVTIGKKRVRLDVDQMIDLLKPHLLGETPSSIYRPQPDAPKKQKSRAAQRKGASMPPVHRRKKKMPRKRRASRT